MNEDEQYVRDDNYLEDLTATRDLWERQLEALRPDDLNRERLVGQISGINLAIHVYRVYYSA